MTIATATARKDTTPRADEILDLCRAAFAQKGFDGASMQDLARSAGMSAGNFYRYFASKEAIIVALVERQLAEIEDQFAQVISAADPRRAFIETLGRHMERQADDDGALWAEIMAAAARRPAVGEILHRMEETVMGHMLRLFALFARVPVDVAAARFRTQAALTFILIRGAGMDCPSDRTPAMVDAGALRALVLRTIDTLIGEIAANP